MIRMPLATKTAFLICRRANVLLLLVQIERQQRSGRGIPQRDNAGRQMANAMVQESLLYSCCQKVKVLDVFWR